MDYEISNKFQSNLSGNEAILWTGHPKRGLMLRGSDAFMIPFSILWGGFAIFWEYTAYTSGAPKFFLVIGGAFVLMGLYLIFGRFIFDALKRNKTYYAVTNERVIILSEFFANKTQSLNLKTLSEISLSEKSNGSGTITFGQQNPFSSWMTGMHWPGMGQNQAPMFELSEEVANVYNIIRDAQKRIER